MVRAKQICLILCVTSATVFGQLTVKNSANEDILTVTEPGNIGVNVSAPATRIDILEIDENSSLDLLHMQETIDNAGAIETVSRLIIKDGGRVGIGTNLPISRVDIEDGDANGTDDLFSVRESTPGSPFPIIRTRLIVKNDGYVGIGTPSPLEQLDINGAIRISNTTTNSAGAIRYTGTDFEGYDGSGWKSLTAGTSSSTWTSIADGIIYDGGNVGIGSFTALSSKLHVDGDIVLGKTMPGSDKSISVERADNITGDGWNLTLRAGDASGTYSAVGGDLILEPGQSVGPTPVQYANVLVLNDIPGRMGVGTLSPLEKVDINGAIRIGTTSTDNDGTIRFTGTDFEGYTGKQWVSLTASGSSSLRRRWPTSGPWRRAGCWDSRWWGSRRAPPWPAACSCTCW